MHSEEEEEPSTPKKSKYSKEKSITRTPRKETKGNKALKFFSNPFFRMESGVNNTYYNCTICKKDLCGNNLVNLASHILYKHEQIYEENIDPIEEPIEVKRLNLLQNCVSICLQICVIMGFKELLMVN